MIKVIPAISIIVPIYNKENYLKTCVDSIINQTLKNIEIICIDDGSSDDSLKVIEQYETDCRLRVISQKNKGVGFARNVGIDSATGEYICFMDPDDYYPNNSTLEKLYNTAKEQEVEICGGSFSSIRDGKIITTYEGLFKGYTFDHSRKMNYIDYQYDYGFQRFIYSLKFIKTNKIYFPNLIRFQDPPFFIKAMYLAKQFYAIKDPVYTYRDSYKEIKWDLTKKIDLLKGILHNLCYSKKNNLMALHHLTYNRLTSPYMKKIILTENDDFSKKILLKQIQNILENVDKKLDLIGIQEIEATLSTENNSKKYEISIIIPVYNVSQFLKECVDSVLNQKYTGLMEIILVDDGSTDDSGDICDDYASKYKDIKVIHKKNGGLSSARNIGAEVSKGKYIYFLDSDDMLKENAIKDMIENMDKFNLDVLCFDATILYDPPEIKSKSSFKETYYKNRGLNTEYIYTGYEALSKFNELNTYRTPVQLYVLKREFFVKKGLSFFDKILHEDNLFTFLCLMEAERVKYVPKDYYIRRIRNNSIMTSTKTYRNYEGYITCCIEMYKYILKNPEKKILGYEILERTKNAAKYTYDSLSAPDKSKVSQLSDNYRIYPLDVPKNENISIPTIFAYIIGKKESDVTITSLIKQKISIEYEIVPEEEILEKYIEENKNISKKVAYTLYIKSGFSLEPHVLQKIITLLIEKNLEKIAITYENTIILFLKLSSYHIENLTLQNIDTVTTYDLKKIEEM